MLMPPITFKGDLHAYGIYIVTGLKSFKRLTMTYTVMVVAVVVVLMLVVGVLAGSVVAV